MIKHSAKITAGLLLVILGILITPLPLPLGLLTMLVGLSILVSALPGLRHRLRQLRSRYAKTSHKLNQLKEHFPQFAQRLIEETDPKKHK